jgi:hypothetical protein
MTAYQKQQVRQYAVFASYKIYAGCSLSDIRHFGNEPCPEVHFLTSDTGTEIKLLVYGF